MIIRNTSHEDQWEAAKNAKPVQDAWLEGLLAHSSEGRGNTIGEPAARDLLREVLRLRLKERLLFRHCSLSGEFHVVRDDKVCEICDCEPREITLDTLEDTLKSVNKFWSDRCLEEKLRADEAESKCQALELQFKGLLEATHRHKKRGTMYRIISEPELHGVTNYPVEGEKLVVYVGENGKAWAQVKSRFDDGRFEEINTVRERTIPTRTDFLPTKEEIARAICRAGTDLDEDGGAESDCDENGPCGTTEGGSCIAPGLYEKAATSVLDLIRRKI